MVVANQLVFRLPGPGVFMPGELVIDSFAGAGGVSLAMEQVFGRSPDYAINHNRIALDTHKMNHPASIHIRENIWKVKPREVVRGRPVGLFWASPDCTHFSKAKGGKPVKQRIRGLANIVVKWAKETKPRIIAMENVEEFMTWGPVILLRNRRGKPKLDKEGRRQYVPDKKRAGEYFRTWKASLEAKGYEIEHRIINAADFGAPTTRKRFFLIARRDRRPIRWPIPSHGPTTGIPYRSAAECIDFDEPCPSIFTRKKSLKPATLRRIAMGVIRYVLNDPEPFLVCLTHGGRLEALHEPFRTITAARRGERAVIAPTLATHTTGHRGRKLTEPVPAMTTGGQQSLVGATMVASGWGERKGQRPRTLDIRKPVTTIPATGTKQALVAAFLNKHNGNGVVGQRLRKSLGTITRRDHHSYGAVHMTKFRGTSKAGKSVRLPVDVITAGGKHYGLVSSFLAKYNGTAVGQRLREGMHTVTAKARFGVVLVNIDGQDYAIADIGMRMLQPRELARAHDFPEHYFLIGTKEQQIAMIGNSVPWRPAAAILRANFEEEYSQVQAMA